MPKETKRRKGVPSRLTDPVGAVILAIDPGRSAGWAVGVAGELRDFGSTRKGEGIAAVVECALEFERDSGWPLVVASEAWAGGLPPSTYAGLGESWGWWSGKLRELGVSERQILRVYAQTWRAALDPGVRRTRQGWKEWAERDALERWGVQVETVDEADALAILAWASYSTEAEALLPRPRGRRSGQP